MSEYNVLLISIDSLRRDFLGAYPTPFDWVADLDVETPTLDAFARRAAVFDTHYVGSLPCMPARREWLTGTQKLLWRPWGPIESYDVTLPQRARRADVLTQLQTDHFHYFQHGSDGYYEDYHGFEFVRGHEDDAWRTDPYDPDPVLLQQVGYDLDGDGVPESGGPGRDNPATDPHNLREIRPRWSYVRNVSGFEDETDFFAPKVLSRTADWLAANREWEQWFCYVDEFDVHEPFHCPEPYASMYTDEDPRDPDLPVWPYYGRTDAGQSEISERELDFVRAQFAGKVTMVDRWLARVFDRMDDLGLWEETVVVVTSDHGHFLGDYGWMGKPSCPDYDVLCRTPLLVWHPDSPRMGERVDALTQSIDLHPTILDVLGADGAAESHGQSLLPLLRGERETHRDWALYGWWGSSVNVTDGRYTYMHPCDPDAPAVCYATSQMEPWGWMGPTSGKTGADAGQFLPYTDTPVWRFEAPPDPRLDGPLLFDTDADPRQTENLAGGDEHARMRELLVAALDDLRAPDQQYERLGLA
ncbi:MAG: sulfatase-like hydrolase/transferase [Halobacteriaceae archaeon]